MKFVLLILTIIIILTILITTITSQASPSLLNSDSDPPVPAGLQSLFPRWLRRRRANPLHFKHWLVIAWIIMMMVLVMIMIIIPRCLLVAIGLHQLYAHLSDKKIFAVKVKVPKVSRNLVYQGCARKFRPLLSILPHFHT